jgi:hypothetical protein
MAATTAVARRPEAVSPAVIHETPDRHEIGFAELLALAEHLVPTRFLPDHIKTPGQAVAIILTGRELGMGPMRAIRSLQLVKGKVVENADSQLSRFKSDGGRATWKELTEKKAVLVLRHPNGDEHTETFTIEDATRAGLTGGENYKKYPKAMLRSRAITAGLKSVGWEGGAGVYDPEEAAAFAPAGALASQGNGAEETGEAATEKQVAFLGRLLKSSVWTQDERVAYARDGESRTKQGMTALVEEVIEEGKRRKAELKDRAERGEDPPAHVEHALEEPPSALVGQTDDLPF